MSCMCRSTSRWSNHFYSGSEQEKPKEKETAEEKFLSFFSEEYSIIEEMGSEKVEKGL